MQARGDPNNGVQGDSMEICPKRFLIVTVQVFTVLSLDTKTISWVLNKYLSLTYAKENWGEKTFISVLILRGQS